MVGGGAGGQQAVPPGHQHHLDPWSRAGSKLFFPTMKGKARSGLSILAVRACAAMWWMGSRGSSCFMHRYLGCRVQGAGCRQKGAESRVH